VTIVSLFERNEAIRQALRMTAGVRSITIGIPIGRAAEIIGINVGSMIVPHLSSLEADDRRVSPLSRETRRQDKTNQAKPKKDYPDDEEGGSFYCKPDPSLRPGDASQIAGRLR